jgi:alkylhydroperoxidase family enzyme
MRLAPIDAPYEPDLARTLARMMPPGQEPLKLFRTVAHNRHILDKLRSTGAYLLNFGTLDPADRELVLQRTCARCGCEYEWGVHAAVFGPQVQLTGQKLTATVNAAGDDPAWSDHDRLLIALADELHDTGTLTDDTYAALAANYDEAQLVELIALAGQYHVVAYLANALGVELEDAGERFPAPAAA